MRQFLPRLAVFALVIMAFLSTAPHSSAGDFADREIIGFSADGSLFAFEEYGTQDGSGFPYANIYVIDTATDSWVSGSPFRVRVDDENAPESEARAAVRQQAAGLINQISEPGFIAATNRHTEVLSDPYRLVANPVSYVPSGRPAMEFRLDVYDVRGENYCSADGTVKAFRLTRVFEQPGSATKLLHDDGQEIPSSRNCALDYQFADLVTFSSPGGGMAGAVLIRYRQLGFEGPDGRYIAVTFRDN
jgi:predicted secreted protein